MEDRTSSTALEIYSGNSLVLVVRDGQGNDTRINLKSGLFKSNQWNTLRLDFLPDGSVIPYINGYNEYINPDRPLKFPDDSNYGAGFVDGHAGLQTTNKSKDDGFSEGQYLLNDNFLVIER